MFFNFSSNVFKLFSFSSKITFFFLDYMYLEKFLLIPLIASTRIPKHSFASDTASSINKVKLHEQKVRGFDKTVVHVHLPFKLNIRQVECIVLAHYVSCVSVAANNPLLGAKLLV